MGTVTAESLRGRVVQADPMEPKLKPPGSKRMKIKCGALLSHFAFKIIVHRYSEGRRSRWSRLWTIWTRFTSI